MRKQHGTKRKQHGTKKTFQEVFLECEHVVVNPRGELHTAFCSECGCEIAIDDGNRPIAKRYE